MSSPQGKDKFTPELRILGAALLSMAVILLWAKYFGPKPPVKPPAAVTASQTAAPTNAAPATPAAATPLATASAAKSGKPETGTLTAVGEAAERTIVVENALYRVEISNRGGVVKSWQLKKYQDDAKPRRVLDVVHPTEAEQTGGWPLALVLPDAQQENLANTGLYLVSTPTNTLTVPADVNFTWSNGHLEITKHFHFDDSYVAQVDVSAKLDGQPVRAGISWLGGFGDLTVANPAPIDTVSTFYSEGGKITLVPAKKLLDLDKVGHGSWQGGKDYAGIEDRYFVAAFLPANGAAAGTVETNYWTMWHSVKIEGQDAPERVPAVAATTTSAPLAFRLYVGPKDYDDLKKLSPPLHGLVNFGWLEILADPIFHGLKWLHKYIHNWGWSIVVLTLLINMVLFPLRISSYKTTLKMQRVGPEVKAIQDRYKKYKLNDPKKAEMNKEVMAVYSREGINPVGGCIPQLLQLPIWYALYRALQGTIEMRHAPWFGWITDLSAKDPFYILPVLMGLSMYFASKMTPMTSTDPQQQAMMKFMPIGMAAMFVVIPYPSGLAVYILTSSLVGVGQQWYLNRTHPLPAPAKLTKGKK